MSNIVLVIVFLGLVIFVHELGHFLFAKLFDVKVTGFSLGFGPALFTFTRGETEYAIRVIPLGGFVRMVGQDETEEIAPEDEGRAFHQKPIWQRALIVFAGPLANFLLPVILYYVVFLMPHQVLGTTIGYTIPDGPADRSGMKVGDKVVQIAGQDVHLFDDMRGIIESRPNQPTGFVVERGGEQKKLTITPEKEEVMPGKSIGRIGVLPYYRRADIGVMGKDSAAYKSGLRTWDRIVEIDGQKIEKWNDVRKFFSKGVSGEMQVKVKRPKEMSLEGIAQGERREETLRLQLPASETAITNPKEAGLESSELYVAKVYKDSPADKAGMEVGDRLLEIDGHKITDVPSLSEIVTKDKQKEGTFKLQWRREGQVLSGEVAWTEIKEKGPANVEMPRQTLGFETYVLRFPAEQITVHDGPIAAAGMAVEEMGTKVAALFMALGMLFSGEAPLNQLGGPILLYQLSVEAAQQGFVYLFQMIAFISINLGLLNLFPIPVLDGGHLMFFLIESIQRKPLSLKVRYAANLLGLVMILMLMIYAIKNDVVRVWFQ